MTRPRQRLLIADATPITRPFRSHAAARLLAALQAEHRETGKTAHQAQVTTLAGLAGCSRGAVRNALAVLVERGDVTVSLSRTRWSCSTVEITDQGIVTEITTIEDADTLAYRGRMTAASRHNDGRMTAESRQCRETAVTLPRNCRDAAVIAGDARNDLVESEPTKSGTPFPTRTGARAPGLDSTRLEDSESSSLSSARATPGAEPDLGLADEATRSPRSFPWAGRRGEEGREEARVYRAIRTHVSVDDAEEAAGHWPFAAARRGLAAVILARAQGHGPRQVSRFFRAAMRGRKGSGEPFDYPDGCAGSLEEVLARAAKCGAKKGRGRPETPDHNKPDDDDPAIKREARRRAIAEHKAGPTGEALDELVRRHERELRKRGRG